LFFDFKYSDQNKKTYFFSVGLTAFSSLATVSGDFSASRFALDFDFGAGFVLIRFKTRIDEIFGHFSDSLDSISSEKESLLELTFFLGGMPKYSRDKT